MTRTKHTVAHSTHQSVCMDVTVSFEVCRDAAVLRRTYARIRIQIKSVLHKPLHFALPSELFDEDRLKEHIGVESRATMIVPGL